MSLRLTNSESKTWQRCRRKWYLGYYRGLQLDTEVLAGRPTTIGTRVHDALADYYDPDKRADPLATLEASIARDLEADPWQEEALRAEQDLCAAMLEGYLQWLEETGADSDYRVLASETMIEVPLAPEHTNATLLSKIDARVERISDSHRVSFEHKTVSSLDQATPILQLDQQLLTEHLVEFMSLRNAGHDAEEKRAAGVLYNMLRKVKRTARAKPPFYGRELVDHNVHELRNHWRHVLRIALDIESATEQLDAGANHHMVAPPNPTRDCKWDCPFLSPCVMLNRGEDAEGYLGEFYREGDPLERYLGVTEYEE